MSYDPKNNGNRNALKLLFSQHTVCSELRRERVRHAAYTTQTRDSPSTAASNTDGDGAAIQADEDVQAIDYDAQQAEDDADAGRAGGLDGVAALDRARVALVHRLRGRRGDGDGGRGRGLGGRRGAPGSGDRKEREQEQCEERGVDFGEHGEFVWYGVDRWVET
jgi:hypothetical protein